MILTTLVLGATLTLADLRKLVSVGQPQISPDAARIVVTIGRRNFDKDRTDTDLVLIDVSSHAQRKLVRGLRISAYAWSPTGTAIAYIAAPVATADAHAQLYVLPMSGGEPLALTDEKNGVNAFAWRRDGKAIAYAATPENPRAKAIEHGEDAFNVTEEAWTEQEPTPTQQLYTIDVAEHAKPRHIGNGTWNVGGGFAYAPDGKSIFVTRITPGYQPNQSFAREIVRVNLSDSSFSQIARLSSLQTDPFFSHDGRHLAFGFGNTKFLPIPELARADADGRAATWVSKTLNRPVTGAGFMPDGTFAVIAPQRTRMLLYHLDGTHAVQLPIGNLNASSLSVANDGTIAFTASSPTTAADVYVLPPGSRQPVRYTDENKWLASITLGRHETVNWRTRNGFVADGVLVYPPHWQSSKRYPMVLLIHGGPTSASTDSFSALADTLAAHGWLVFQPNYIGSNSEGIAYVLADAPHVSSVAAASIEDGVNALRTRGIIDPQKIAVSGWSAGGQMTSWLITHDTRWVAAVDGAAVDDWLQISAMTDSKSYNNYLIGFDPWSHQALFDIYKEESPLTYADRVKTPTLILSDASDYRVPTPLSYEFYHAIRATGTPVKFVVWPVVGHFPTDPVRVEDVYRQWEAWLVTYLK
jgi:dipeptidyl aminopeptidase/acylaminoacyl peptidase